MNPHLKNYSVIDKVHYPKVAQQIIILTLFFIKKQESYSVTIIVLG